MHGGLIDETSSCQTKRKSRLGPLPGSSNLVRRPCANPRSSFPRDSLGLRVAGRSKFYVILGCSDHRLFLWCSVTVSRFMPTCQSWFVMPFSQVSEQRDPIGLAKMNMCARFRGLFSTLLDGRVEKSGLDRTSHSRWRHAASPLSHVVFLSQKQKLRCTSGS